MKNLLESFAILLVGLLSLAIVFFIVQYNLIEDDSISDEIAFDIPVKKESTKAKTSSYLDSLEGYGDDKDVKVDARKETSVNTVVIKSELKNDDLGAVVDDKSKNSYMKNLENYADTAEKENLDKAKPKVDNSGEPEKLPQEEIVDEIGMAIDAALDDL
jgi:hypothetical protein